MKNVLTRARKEIIYTNDLVACPEQDFAKMAADESGATGDEGSSHPQPPPSIVPKSDSIIASVLPGRFMFAFDIFAAVIVRYVVYILERS